MESLQRDFIDCFCDSITYHPILRSQFRYFDFPSERPRIRMSGKSAPTEAYDTSSPEAVCLALQIPPG